MSATVYHTPTIDDSVLETYSTMSKRGGDHIHWCVFKHDEDAGVITLETTGDGPYADLVAALPEDDSRWALLNARYTTEGGGKRSKLTMITWIPDSIDRGSMKATIKAKTLPIMYTKLLKREMTGIVCNIQANVADSLEEEEVLQRVSKFEHDPVDTSAGIAI